MERLSSRTTFALKRIFPVIWIGILIAFVATSLASGVALDHLDFIVVPVLMIGIGLLVFRTLLWDLIDEVDLSAELLVVCKGSKEERIALDDVINVSMSQFTNPSRLSLRLRSPGAFDDEVVFIPISGFRLNPFAPNAVAETLIQRVDRARRQSGGRA